MLEDLTFITSLQIESKDRLRNAITVFSYLSNNFPDSQILIKEIDKESKFLKYALPEIKNKCKNIDNISHTFVEHGKLFNKSEAINNLALEAKTNIVFNYDVDVLLPISTYLESYRMLQEDECDVVYPYGCGVYQWNVLNFDPNAFFDNGCNLNSLVSYSQRGSSVQGWCQMFKRKVFYDVFGLNENFIFVGYEDTEFLHRLNVFGYRVGRVKDNIFHLDHVKIHNKNYSDREFFEKNISLWEWMRKQDKPTIENYYRSQEYIKKFK